MMLANFSGGLRMAKDNFIEEMRKRALRFLAKANVINST